MQDANGPDVAATRSSRRGRRKSWAAANPQLAAVGLLLACLVVRGAELPAVEYLLPAGARQGASLNLFAEGKLESWPISVWADHPGVVFAPGADRGHFRVAIAADTPPGPHLLRFFHDDGASEPRIFVVGDLPEAMEWELPAEDRRGSRIQQLPLVVNGRLKKAGEKDTFFLALAGKSEFRAVIQAQGFDSPLRSALTLLDDQGITLASSQPADGADPWILCRIEQPGVYRLVVTEAAGATRSTTGEAAVYRLRLEAVRVEPTPELPLDEQPPSIPENEIVRAYQSAQQVELPGTIHGHIDPPGEQDRYMFAAQQGDRITAQIRAASLGSALTPVLKVLDEAGFTLAETAASPDSQVSFVAPAEGNYYLAVSDAHRRGGLSYRYELELGPLTPHVAGVLGADRVRLEPGQTNQLTVAIIRPRSCQTTLTLAVLGLPEQVTASWGPLPAEVTEARVALAARAGAQPLGQSFRVMVVVPDPAIPQAVTATIPLRGRHAPPGRLLINEIDHIWLTVPPKRPTGHP